MEMSAELKQLLDQYGNQAWKWGHASAQGNAQAIAKARAACIQARTELSTYYVNNQ